MITEADTPVEAVARLAMGRERLKIYDNIVVTEGGTLRGTVSVQKMLDTLASIQVEMAKGANPLSGLPGNVAIEQGPGQATGGKRAFLHHLLRPGQLQELQRLVRLQKRRRRDPPDIEDIDLGLPAATGTKTISSATWGEMILS